MKVYVDAWIYVTEKFVNVGNIELYEEISRYEKADYPPIPNFMLTFSFCIRLYPMLDAGPDSFSGRRRSPVIVAAA